MVTAYVSSTAPDVVNRLITDSRLKGQSAFCGPASSGGSRRGSGWSRRGLQYEHSLLAYRRCCIGGNRYPCACSYVNWIGGILGTANVAPDFRFNNCAGPHGMDSNRTNSNAVAALAIASGVGIDSEVYLLFRVREEYQKLGDFKEALVQGYVKIRRALIVSNGALIFGCCILVPVPLYIGYVGFGMGVVLAMCFIMSAILSPILWSWFGQGIMPKEVETNDSPEVHRRLQVSELS